MEKEIVKFNTPELELIEKSKAEKIKQTFDPMVKMLEEFDAVYIPLLEEANNEITETISAKAKRLRLDIGKVRIETGKLKDKQKEYIKLEDRAIMGVHNILVWAVKEKEDKLKEIENYFENIEKERIQKLQDERLAELHKFEPENNTLELGSMPEDVYKNYINGVRLNYEAIKKAEKEAEEERKEKLRLDNLEQGRFVTALNYRDFWEKDEYDFRGMSEGEFDNLILILKTAKKKYIIEQERISKENLRLKKEQEEKDKQLEIERQKRKEEAEKQRIENEKKIEAERKEREIAEQKIKAMQEEEERKKREEEERKEAELNKGDEDKVKDLVLDIENIKTKYVFESSKNKSTYLVVKNKLSQVIEYINNNK